MTRLRLARQARFPATSRQLAKVSTLVFLSLGLLLSQAACALPLGIPETRITGIVYGDSVPVQEQGTSQAVPLHGALVQCGNATARTNINGQYTLSVASHSTYSCTASAPLYLTQNVTLQQANPANGDHLVLDFGPAAETICTAASVKSFTLDCGLLDLDPGSLAGTVISDGNNALVSNAVVNCVRDNPAALTSPLDSSTGVTALTGTDGSFSLTGLAVGTYTCLSFTDGVNRGHQQVTIAPSAITTTTLRSCSSDCHPVEYHGGPVMRALKAYVIFWLPSGYSFDPGGSDTFYESLIESFFQDLQGTRYFEQLGQYWDYQGPIQDQVTLGGVYIDRSPYEHCTFSGLNCTPAAASTEDPLLDADIEGEISRALKTNPSWSAAQTHAFFVYTANGAQECAEDRPGVDCTYSPYPDGFCAYHSFFSDAGPEFTPSDGTPPDIYAYVPAPEDFSATTGCTASDLNLSPVDNHGDGTADMAVNFTSHEMVESITDPIYYTPPGNPPLSGWFNDAQSAKGSDPVEIADLCDTDYGQIGADGADLTLQHGDRYLVQEVWSNLTNSCSLG